MKAVFCLPAHPSYFGGEYTQEEIDAAYLEYDQRQEGLIFSRVQGLPVTKEFRLLKQPGQDSTVSFETTGLCNDDSVLEADKQQAIEELAAHISNISNLLIAKRRGYW